jgi:hypothetical protein
MYFVKQPVKKKRRDATRGNGGRHKATIFKVWYSKVKGGFKLYTEGLIGALPAGYGVLTEAQAETIGKQLAKETKAEWIGKI